MKGAKASLVRVWPAFFPAAAVVLLSLAGLGVTMAAEATPGPFLFESAAKCLYRAYYLVSFPLRLLLVPTLRVMPGDKSMPALALVSVLTPLFWYGVWRLRQRWYGRMRSRPPRADAPTRRAFLKTATFGLWSGMAGVGAYSTMMEPERLVVQRYRIAVLGLPQSLDGLTIVQLSDTHYSAFMSLKRLLDVLDFANRLRPDLFVLTGDYVYSLTQGTDPALDIYGRLRSPLGTVAVLGNHDHYHGAEECRRGLTEAGIRMLDNNRAFVARDRLYDEVQPESLCLAGVGDLWTDSVLFRQALGGVPPEMPRLLLSHNPDVAEELPPGVRVDLMLAGHTHGGQVRLPVAGAPGVPSRFGQKYAGGLCNGPHCPVLVSRGVGTVIFPVRFCVPPELSLITLLRKE